MNPLRAARAADARPSASRTWAELPPCGPECSVRIGECNVAEGCGWGVALPAQEPCLLREG